MRDIYCDQIIPGKLAVEVIFETERIMAFHHTKPYWEHHVVIIPKAHIESLPSYPNEPELNQDMMAAISFVTRMFEEQFGGCRISSNVGDYQTSKHLHWYVHAGERLLDEDGKVRAK